MTFLLRAALVIGVLSYLAATRQGTAPTGLDAAALRSTVATTTGSLASLAASLPPEARTEALRLGGEAVARRLTGQPASADTLSASDRAPAWRGAGGH
ncbi:hypothetical protein ASG52_11510 [Methylobacterium sp. Leaf456]|uniref:hypothetical protein n=1 Tax=Methylobacterium sp. Leaf456 TaxID=1736382 RepID=UPI0006F3B4F9|nr:hypothetical protein [Methylobacterium sp. Leaf456]KQT47881.1 hypothetical protein ASG52_11510 [Methylobacterium sp. Leaf456]